MRTGVLLFLGLIAAALFNIAMHIRSWRRERVDRLIMLEVHAVLMVWVETWPVEDVRRQLRAALARVHKNISTPAA